MSIVAMESNQKNLKLNGNPDEMTVNPDEMTVNPDEMALYEPYHLDLHCLHK